MTKLKIKHTNVDKLINTFNKNKSLIEVFRMQTHYLKFPEFTDWFLRELAKKRGDK